MNGASAERVRVFLVHWLFTTLYGMALDEYLALLRKHRFAVDAPYLPRAAFMGLSCTLTSLIRAYEDRMYGRELADIEVREPLFILGHWRSGTTYLHSLFALDKRFAHPNVWRVFNPHTFLTTERYSDIVKLALPKTRLIDSMDVGADVPFEDEYATCGTLCSPILAGVFPQAAEHYDRYLTFRGVPEEEVARWQKSLMLFYKKMTWKLGRPLVLKSPPHTCRIRLLLEMFPDARFVHIHRDPYAVFRSTRGTIRTDKTLCLQASHPPDPDARIIHRYRIMYDSFFEERHLIPEGRFHELSFEELEKDPIRVVRRIYERLDIPGFEEFEPSLKQYVGSISGYRKNEFPELPTGLREKIAHAWERSFEEWGYPRD